jgi:oxygen-independent coproporphyrinogen III oxidase
MTPRARRALMTEKTPGRSDNTGGETRAGGYFVANYPPFGFWSADQVGEVHEAFARPPTRGTPLGLYVHLPFCRQRCRFCYFKVEIGRSAEDVRRYVDAVVAELRLQAGAAFVGGRAPLFVYFGGGTPSYLSTKQLETLVCGLREQLPFDAAEEVAFECEPGTLDERKLRLLRELGVTRLSLGVESLDDQVLEQNGRGHRAREVLVAYERARRLGFPQINVDLIAGMVADTEERWDETVRRTAELAPDSVTIYQLEIPFNTVLYRELGEEGLASAPVADWPTKRARVARAYDALEAAGYSVTSTTTAVRVPATTRFLYREALWHGADMIALGVASFGHVSRTHYQNEKRLDLYLQAVEQGHLPLARGLRLTADEALIREVVLQLKLGHVDVAAFRARFGVDITARFAGPFGRLADRGWLHTSGERLELSREALLQVDALLPDFFLPEHRAGDPRG